MSTQLEFYCDNGGRNAYAPFPSTNMFSATLVNGAAASVTVPKSNVPGWIVSFSYAPGSVVWVDFTGATAAVPAGATFAASTSELNPGARYIKTYKADGTTANTFSLITSNATADVSVAFYAVQ